MVSYPALDLAFFDSCKVREDQRIVGIYGRVSDGGASTTKVAQLIESTDAQVTQSLPVVLFVSVIYERLGGLVTKRAKPPDYHAADLQNLK